MHSIRIMAAGLSLWALALAGTAAAQDITALDNGYLTFTNGNTSLYYRVEYKADLMGPEAWDGTYSRLKNIQTNAATVTVPVGVFYRVVGSSNPLPVAPLAKTGATNLPSYTAVAGEDGHADMRKGVAWPSPRFTDNGNGTVTDNLTGLIWLKNANCIKTDYPSFDNDGTAGDGRVTWPHALDFVAGMNAGTYTNKGYTDWRLPNLREMRSLFDLGRYNPALSLGHPFAWVEPGNSYWCSTTMAASTNNAWTVTSSSCGAGYVVKESPYMVWPVRAGQ